MSSAPTADLIERLQAAAEEAKQTIRELHEARRDARQSMVELREMADRIKSETIEGHNELSMKWWREAMDNINIHDLGAGLKKSFDEWVTLLAEASDVLASLHHKDEEFAELLARARARGL